MSGSITLQTIVSASFLAATARCASVSLFICASSASIRSVFVMGVPFVIATRFLFNHINSSTVGMPTFLALFNVLMVELCY